MNHTDSTNIRLRDTAQSDLQVFYGQQLDKEAGHMAAFTHKDPADREAFMLHWQKILADKNILIMTILYDGQIAGYILSHDWFGQREVSYWIGKAFWGQGVATCALSSFLLILKERPLYARVAKDNLASRRVLEKCGFAIYAEDIGFANARGEEVEELILKLDI